VLRESIIGALVASICSLLGAMLPLLFSVMLPDLPLVGLALTILLLGVLDALLAWSTFGSPTVWAIAMMAGGIVLAIIGVKLDIVS